MNEYIGKYLYFIDNSKENIITKYPGIVYIKFIFRIGKENYISCKM